MEDQILKVKETQVAIIKNKFYNLLFYALLNEMKKDNAACEAKMTIEFSNEEAPVTNLENPIGQLAHALEEQYSMPLPSDIKDEDKRECNFVPLSFKEEIQDLTLVEEKNNELANEEELLVEKRQVEEQHPRKTIENVLLGIDNNFPIDFLTLSMEEDQQFSSIGTPSNATNQAWIDIEHREITLLVGKEKLKFNLHQNIQLTDEEKKCCMRIESSLLPIYELAPTIVQEETLEGCTLKSNSFPTKELDFELTSHNTEVEDLIFTSDKDEEGVLTMMDEGPKKSSRTSPMSLAGL